MWSLCWKNSWHGFSLRWREPRALSIKNTFVLVTAKVVFERFPGSSCQGRMQSLAHGLPSPPNLCRHGAERYLPVQVCLVLLWPLSFDPLSPRDPPLVGPETSGKRSLPVSTKTGCPPLPLVSSERVVGACWQRCSTPTDISERSGCRRRLWNDVVDVV